MGEPPPPAPDPHRGAREAFLRLLGFVYLAAFASLWGRDPFAGRPPRDVRALVYDYRFMDLATHRRTGEWWQRRLEGVLCAPVSRFSPAGP